MCTGLIFDIERFSAKDGPGLRTVVFFKGCNLSCKWCHNPEGIHSTPEIMFSPEKCILCKKCKQCCRNEAHVFPGDLHFLLTEKCNQCLACTKVCFSGALQCIGKTMTVNEVMTEILSDKKLYEKSGGGVTLTGGEVMLQTEFAASLLRACSESGISTAIETNLNVPWRNYERVLPYTDMVFADIKLLDEQAHICWTGSGNRQILSNLEKLKADKTPFIIRTPIIPGVNDREEEIKNIAEKLRNSKNLCYYELLSYNALGNSKGTLVNVPDIRLFEALDSEKARALATAASKIIPTKLDGKEVL